MKARSLFLPVRAVLGLALLAILADPCVQADEAVPASPPKRIRIRELDPRKPGFKVELSREAAEKLRDTLNDKVDEKKIADVFTDLAEEPKQKFVIKLVSLNVSKFKEQLTKKMGKNGVVVTVTGPRLRDPDSYPAFDEKTREAIREVLPEGIKGILAALNTNPKLALVSPWFWSIAPKDD